ncbi:MAG: CAP domain-containing protein [Anaerolineales bacterium]|nr:CAP domain-containing protein [Anaerolineales bacterium]
MKRFWTLSALLFLLTGLLGLSPLARAEASSAFSPPQQDSPTDTPSASSPPTPGEIIAAVNNLRASRGTRPLTTNSILMQVAADQANALAASEGAIGHERPCGMTLGQDLLRRGFPLAGALSLDGYRSENWVAASTAEDAINFWLGDDPHTNTMLSENRSDIGAAVAVSDQTYIVLETALGTASGKMQYEAAGILTGIPMTVAACSGQSTQDAANSLLPQYSVPVARHRAPKRGCDPRSEVWTGAVEHRHPIRDDHRADPPFEQPAAHARHLSRPEIDCDSGRHPARARRGADFHPPRRERGL